ncbi:DNA oxidative demethylase AlkB [Pseudomonas luteola]|uniref:DNA oxidative demethylase AlkB n=1 Tax=Pseudomonas luteola TaxID=47886 RepID=UPI001ED91B25|nr:DNA oxidative demethylase AlkB [Pseudomonas luteola]MCG7374147.1 DNA oxidative demethylase AlkB [Pseudomonas luteola]
MTPDLFAKTSDRTYEQIGRSSFVLRGFANEYIDQIIKTIGEITALSPFRHMITPGGYKMSVALTNCGPLGWTTNKKGYFYTSHDPENNQPWPAMPSIFSSLAANAAAVAGFENFKPDACLINRYSLGSKLSLHQDKNEKDFTAPIVSVSLGMSAVFLFGGHDRKDPVQRIILHHGDVAVWGGIDRLRYHGVMPLKGNAHEALGYQRINFTFRKVA